MSYHRYKSDTTSPLIKKVKRNIKKRYGEKILNKIEEIDLSSIWTIDEGFFFKLIEPILEKSDDPNESLDFITNRKPREGLMLNLEDILENKPKSFSLNDVPDDVYDYASRFLKNKDRKKIFDVLSKASPSQKTRLSQFIDNTINRYENKYVFAIANELNERNWTYSCFEGAVQCHLDGLDLYVKEGIENRFLPTLKAMKNKFNNDFYELSLPVHKKISKKKYVEITSQKIMSLDFVFYLADKEEVEIIKDLDSISDSYLKENAELKKKLYDVGGSSLVRTLQSSNYDVKNVLKFVNNNESRSNLEDIFYEFEEKLHTLDDNIDYTEREDFSFSMLSDELYFDYVKIRSNLNYENEFTNMISSIAQVENGALVNDFDIETILSMINNMDDLFDSGVKADKGKKTFTRITPELYKQGSIHAIREVYSKLDNFNDDLSIVFLENSNKLYGDLEYHLSKLPEIKRQNKKIGYLRRVHKFADEDVKSIIATAYKSKLRLISANFFAANVKDLYEMHEDLPMKYLVFLEEAEKTKKHFANYVIDSFDQFKTLNSHAVDFIDKLTPLICEKTFLAKQLFIIGSRHIEGEYNKFERLYEQIMSDPTISYIEKDFESSDFPFYNYSPSFFMSTFDRVLDGQFRDRYLLNDNWGSSINISSGN